MRPLAPLLLLLVAGSSALAGGCGYNQSGGEQGRLDAGYAWSGLYREDVQSVAVPTFTTKDFRRGVEMRLTEAVIKQLEASAPYKVVSRERADTVLEGQVTGVTLQTVNRDHYTNLPRAQVMTVTVDLTWKDLRTGRVLLQRKDFSQQATFYPQLAEGEFAGSQEAIEKLALAIVQEMQADW